MWVQPKFKSVRLPSYRNRANHYNACKLLCNNSKLEKKATITKKNNERDQVTPARNQVSNIWNSMCVLIIMVLLYVTDFFYYLFVRARAYCIVCITQTDLAMCSQEFSRNSAIQKSCNEARENPKNRSNI